MFLLGEKPNYTDGMADLLMKEKWSTRAKFRLVARDVVTEHYIYSLPTPPEAKGKPNEAALRAKQLAAHVTTLIGPKKGTATMDFAISEEGVAFAHPSIKDLIVKFLFNPVGKDRPLAVLNENRVIDNIPLPAIAFAATTLYCCLREWQSGQLRKLYFREHPYEAIYKSVHKNLVQYQQSGTRSEKLEKLRKDILAAGTRRVGQLDTEDIDMQMLFEPSSP
ncbi:hypothetical protein DFH11DRAFT_1726812 [Phellopilus nigrolimitatus]|nr:hypothetical protein DFH11DRAFT_1726812 [Phellopilus nigrolimitatus]